MKRLVYSLLAFTLLLTFSAMPAVAQNKIRVQQIEDVPFWQMDSTAQVDADMANGRIFLTDGSSSTFPAGTLVYKDFAGGYHNLEEYEIDFSVLNVGQIAAICSVVETNCDVGVSMNMTPAGEIQLLNGSGNILSTQTISASIISSALSPITTTNGVPVGIGGNYIQLSNGETWAFPSIVIPPDGEITDVTATPNATNPEDIDLNFTGVNGAFNGTVILDLPIAVPILPITLADTSADASHTQSFNDFGQSWDNLGTFNVNQAFGAFPGVFGSTQWSTGGFDIDVFGAPGVNSTYDFNSGSIDFNIASGTEAGTLDHTGGSFSINTLSLIHI